MIGTYHIWTGWFCVSTWHRLELSLSKELQLGKCLHEIQLWGIFSISDQVVRAPCGWFHLWAGALGFYKRAGWASQGKQASKKHPSMVSASAPASWPAWVPVLTSFSDELQRGSLSSINSFLPNLLLGHDVCAGIETLTKTNWYQEWHIPVTTWPCFGENCGRTLDLWARKAIRILRVQWKVL